MILADEMGLGKTAQCASLLDILATGSTSPNHDVTTLCVCFSEVVSCTGFFTIVACLHGVQGRLVCATRAGPVSYRRAAVNAEPLAT